MSEDGFDRCDRVGVVAIGRNEGERLRRCLDSVVGCAAVVVYVDSGSTDGSIELARELGVEVVELDLSKPFSAARARNEGIRRLRTIAPELEYVQVVDGDCEIADGWLGRAVEELDERHGVAVVCGRRRERRPEESIYNRLCNMEWDTPVGDARACGGDALMRLAAITEVGGYDDALIAGEEPEMCLRLRRAGWTISRVDAEMTLHDAAISRFGQWWRRAARNGHAYAEGRAMHGDEVERYRVDEVRSILEWSVLLPAIALGLAWVTWGASLALFGGYWVLWWKVRGDRLSRGDSDGDAALFARYCVLGKFAEVWGVGQFWWNRFAGKRAVVMEYRRAEAGASSVEAA